MRLLILIFIMIGFSQGLNKNWIILNWSQFFHDIGFERVDPQKEIEWNQVIKIIFSKLPLD